MHPRTYSHRILTAAFAVALFGSASSARTPVDEVNKDGQNAALKGYDPVAFFAEARLVKGSPAYVYEWKHAKWYFASEKSRDLFRAAPDKYAPQFGGYCAWAVSHGYTADVDPEAWKIVEGKLYLNYNKDVQKKWEQDEKKYIEDGIRAWPDLHK